MVYSVCLEQSSSTGKPAVSKFDYLRRHEVIDYVTQKYGKERVSQVATFSSLSTKAVLKDVARILDIDHTLINEINKHVPVVFGKPYTIERCLGEVDAIREFAEKYPRLFELALELQSMPRSAGIHACAIMISPNNISEEIPLMKGKNDEVVTQYEGPVMEENGYIKFDFLGLKNLSVIDISRRLVRERHKKDIDPDKLVPDDPRVFETIRSGRTQGLFQIEGQGITKVFTGLNVVDFESLIAGVSLYRPGPMAFIPDYQARANKLQEVKYFHEDGKEVLESTFGIMVYQEQLMKLSQRLAGYSAGEADMLRKACGKKSQAVMDKVLPELRQRTIENGYEPRIADQLVKLIEPFVGYGLQNV